MKKTIFLISLFTTIFTGCQKNETEPIYEWNNYIYSSIAYGLFGDKEEIRDKHKLELITIIQESESKNIRVAPGIYAEYAQVLFTSGQKDEAKKYFILEKTTYPESAIFIDKVLLKLYGEVK